MEIIILMLLMLWYPKTTEQEIEPNPVYNKIWEVY